MKAYILSLLFTCFLHANPLLKDFEEKGYSEIVNEKQGSVFYDQLYRSFDRMIGRVTKDSSLRKKLAMAKNRFWKTELGQFYATPFVGYGDDSKLSYRKLYYFYYSTDFHDFLKVQYPEILENLDIREFLTLCREITVSSMSIFERTREELSVGALLDSPFNRLPLLLKIVKYLPGSSTVPHFDASAFSLFLDSTDHQSLLLAPYKETIEVFDFFVPPRQYPRLAFSSSSLLIPGKFLQGQEPYINPTPHAALRNDSIRYSVIAFCVVPFKQPVNGSLPSMPQL